MWHLNGIFFFYVKHYFSLFFPPHFHFNFMVCKIKTSLRALDAHLLLRVHICRDPPSFQSINRPNADIPVLDGDSWQSQIGSKLAPLQLFELFSCSSSSVHQAFSSPISFPSHSVYVRPMSVLRFSSLSLMAVNNGFNQREGEEHKWCRLPW